MKRLLTAFGFVVAASTPLFAQPIGSEVAVTGGASTEEVTAKAMQGRVFADTSWVRVFGEDVHHILPIISPGGSDSAMLDNVADLLLHAGRSLPHVMMMLVPEAWSTNEQLDPDRRAFYEYHACMMEPWDGPAAIAFTPL